MRLALERLDAAIDPQILVAIRRDVRRAAECGEAQAYWRDRETCLAERPADQPARDTPRYGSLRIRAFSASNSASVRTPDALSSPTRRSRS